MKKVQAGLGAAGAAFTALGAAGMKMVSDSKKWNASLGQTALTLGVTTDELRDLALSVTNVTFPLQSVTETFELLARAGVKDTEMLVDAANAFDALADATGSSAETVADILIPAFKSLGVEMPRSSSELDKFTWLTKNTTIDLSDFGSVMQYVAMYGADLNMTIDDMVGIMAALEARGISGSAATRLFRTAVTQAADGSVTLNEALGVTKDQIANYNRQIAASSGLTDEYAAIANTQYTLIDKLKQKYQEVTLATSEFLEPLEGVFGAMTALGPVLIAVSMALPALRAGFTALQVKMHGVKLAAISMWSAVTLGASLAIAAAIELWQNWDTVSTFLINAWKNIKKTMLDWIVSMLDGLSGFLGWIPGLKDKIGEARDAIQNMIDRDAISENADAAERAMTEFYESVEERAKELTGVLKSELEKQRDAELAEITKRQETAKKEYETAVNEINKKYGVLTDSERDLTVTVMDEARARTEAAKKEYDREIDAARAAYDAKIALLDEEKAARLALFDAETAAQVQALQDRISAIDEATAREELAATRKTESERLAELQSAIDAAETDEDKAEAAGKYAEYETTVRRNELLRQRNAEKESLRLQIDQVRETARTARQALDDQLTEEYNAKKAAAEAELNEIILPNLEAQKAALDEALKLELIAIDDQRLEIIDIKTEELNGILSLMDQEKAARDAYFAEQLNETRLQVAALNRAWAELRLENIANMQPAPLSPEARASGMSAPLIPMAAGGLIPEPTLLYGLKSMKPYAIAGESGPERVSPMGGGTANILVYLDGNVIARAIGQPLVDTIRVRTGVRI